MSINSGEVQDLEEMMGERGVAVDHTTLYRWVQRYAPELEKRMLWYQNRISFSWRIDETYIRVKGQWKYLYRAIDKGGYSASTPDGRIKSGRNWPYYDLCNGTILAALRQKIHLSPVQIP